MIIYGWRAAHLKSAQSIGEACPHCGSERSLVYHVYSKHAHVFWIPLFPIGKTGVAECTHCKYAMKPREMQEGVRREYRALKAETRTPLWQFVGLGLVLLLAIFMIYGITADKKAEKQYVAHPQTGDLYHIVNDDGQYSAAKVYQVVGDSAYLYFNDYQIDKKAQVNKLDKVENYGDTAYPIALTRLRELYEQGDIYRVYRKDP